jgi:hypothetical protein
MAVTNFSPLLGLALPTTGDLSGTWGTTVNDAITSLIDSSVAGTTTLSTDVDVTLTTTNGAANQARSAVLLCTGARTTVKTITAPAQSKAYIVINATTGGFGVKVVGSGPTTGLTIGSGEKSLIAWNGSDFVLVASGGTVTAVSVASANGLAGTSSGGATPALTLSTTVTGVVKGNGTTLSAATAGTDYVAPGTATTFTATQTFSGTSSVLGMILNDAAEVATVSATAATGTINYDVTTQSVLFYTTNASANWTVNFRASSGTSLNTAMTTGQSVTAAFLVTQGATAYYNSVVQVDGATVTPKYQGGTAPTAGNASSVDVYVYTIIKTAAATFSVFASQTRFA